jgi:hypothetical protein
VKAAAAVVPTFQQLELIRFAPATKVNSVPPAERERRCRTCEVWYDENFFSPCGVRKDTQRAYRELDCKACRLTARTDMKNATSIDGVLGRHLVKARWAIAHHARKFIRAGVVRSKKELVVVFGWRAVDMARDIAYTWTNGCPDCSRPFAQIPNGLSSMTIDIIDPRQPPHYRTNTRWVCRACCRVKAAIPPEDWAAYQRWLASQATHETTSANIASAPKG